MVGENCSIIGNNATLRRPIGQYKLIGKGEKWKNDTLRLECKY